MKGSTAILILLGLTAAGVAGYLLWRNFSGRGRNQKYNDAYQRGEVTGPVIPDEIYKMMNNGQ